MSSDRRIEALLNAAAELGPQIAKHAAKAGNLDGFARYADDPAGFFADVLRIPAARFAHLVPIMDAVRDHALVAVRSSNGWGKDWVAARLALWHVYARRGLVLVSGPTERQCRVVVMGEVRRAFLAAPTLPGTLHEMALKVPAPESMGIVAMTSTEASKLSGFHAPRLMVLVTEAQAVEDYAYEGLLACATGEDSTVLAVGNPLLASGKFYEIHHGGAWHSIALSAFDHPNVKLQRSTIPGAVTQRFIDMIAREYGESGGVYAARVLGEFPEGDGDALCARAWLEKAHALHAAGAFMEESNAAGPVFALDPARFGTDQTVCLVKKGPRVDAIKAWGGVDTVESAKRLLEVALDYGKTCLPVRPGWGDCQPKIVVDEPGLGAGVIDALKLMGCEKVTAFNGGAKPRSDKYQNRRAEVFWALRTLLEKGQLALPVDERLDQELCEMRWQVTPLGRIKIEEKDALRSRLGRSPDRADALSMAVALEIGPARARFFDLSIVGV